MVFYRRRPPWWLIVHQSLGVYEAEGTWKNTHTKRQQWHLHLRQFGIGHKQIACIEEIFRDLHDEIDADKLLPSLCGVLGSDALAMRILMRANHLGLVRLKAFGGRGAAHRALRRHHWRSAARLIAIEPTCPMRRAMRELPLAA